MSNNRKVLIILIALVVALSILGVLIFVLLNENSKGFADIAVNPRDSKYTLNGKEYTGKALVKLKEGEYKATFSRKYFVNKEVKISVKKKKTSIVTVELELDKSITIDYSKLSEDERNMLQSFTDIKSDNDSQKFTDANPLIKELPYISRSFRIDYGGDPNDKNNATYQITIYPNASGKTEAALREEASQWISERGYDINKLKVEWFVE